MFISVVQTEEIACMMVDGTPTTRIFCTVFQSKRKPSCVRRNSRFFH